MIVRSLLQMSLREIVTAFGASMSPDSTLGFTKNERQARVCERSICHMAVNTAHSGVRVDT